MIPHCSAADFIGEWGGKFFGLRICGRRLFGDIGPEQIAHSLERW